MQTEIIIAGFGGQGVLFGGQLLTYAAMDEGKEVTWIPSYGPEMRGGTANCTVVISDDEIGSPMVSNPQAAIVMNLPSLDKYEPLIKPGGVLVINESMVDRKPLRKDINVVMVKANDIAEKLGDRRLSNMVMLGRVDRQPAGSTAGIDQESIGRSPARASQEITTIELSGPERGREV